jgi:dipeptidase D
LGADNGVGVALILSLLTDPTVKHGPIEAIFTVQEETTTIGAVKLSNN